MQSLRELCLSATTLCEEDIQILEDLAAKLQIFADLSQADMFIDCSTTDHSSALVVAQASPSTAKSLYSGSVVGQLATAVNEPAVMYCLTTGKPVISSRGVSQEQVVMRQSVVPIKNQAGSTIGTLITEQDISKQVEQEKNVEMLKETTEHLSETLIQFAVPDMPITSLLHEGMILFDQTGTITYANERAHELLHQIGYGSPEKGVRIEEIFAWRVSPEYFVRHGGFIQEELSKGRTYIMMKAVSSARKPDIIGGIILLRDISDIREKEKQLMIKSAVIKEIHHRVKNNLQTITSLLRLQMRRSTSQEIEKVYRESINRINSIAIIHEYLAHDGLEKIDFKEILTKISKIIVSSMRRSEQAIQVVVTGESVYLPSNKATSFALIVTELVQNCMIHAFAEMQEGVIALELVPKEDFVSLSVTDNGIGMADMQHVLEKGHLGLKIVDTLVREDLEGTIHFRNTGNGTEVTILYPIHKEDADDTAQDYRSG
ncbi:histidine kinase N-terminal domain-containing protein [Brevibacillus sp. AY1]|uniref:sensor histidine kinase n=1 Tax=Brevibacillus sp. AY1 TaxID=2807621 RepID=UPI00245614FD|nr:histidine kinase N-terminal domain-containing protein [Brevibacillus sp. AY1]MDH4617488.1 histidine kinase N-terminal domain-containing protein [Brevibacillus sp. AY1]